MLVSWITLDVDQIKSFRNIHNAFWRDYAKFDNSSHVKSPAFKAVLKWNGLDENKNSSERFKEQELVQIWIFPHLVFSQNKPYQTWA